MQDNDKLSSRRLEAQDCSEEKFAEYLHDGANSRADSQAGSGRTRPWLGMYSRNNAFDII